MRIERRVEQPAADGAADVGRQRRCERAARPRRCRRRLLLDAEGEGAAVDVAVGGRDAEPVDRVRRPSAAAATGSTSAAGRCRGPTGPARRRAPARRRSRRAGSSDSFGSGVSPNVRTMRAGDGASSAPAAGSELSSVAWAPAAAGKTAPAATQQDGRRQRPQECRGRRDLIARAGRRRRTRRPTRRRRSASSRWPRPPSPTCPARVPAAAARRAPGAARGARGRTGRRAPAGHRATWKPWKPVSTKNDDATMFVVSPNAACVYSHAWPPRKTTPSTTVSTSRKRNQPLRRAR